MASRPMHDRAVATRQRSAPRRERPRRVRVHAQGPADDADRARRTWRSSCATAPARSPRARFATPTPWPGASSAATSVAVVRRTACRALPRRARARGARRSPAGGTAARVAGIADLDRLASFRRPTATSTSSTASSSTSPARSTTGASARCSSRCSPITALRAAWRRAPCTRAGHHAYLGGLLEHTVAVATLAARALPAAPAR